MAASPERLALESEWAELCKREAGIRELEAMEAELRRRNDRNKLFQLYPDSGPLRRELYPKHLEFFAAGGKHEAMPTCGKDCDGGGHRERLSCSSNRSGKTWGLGCFETTLHLTGLYPNWWTGKRFDKPIEAWTAGVNGQTVHRDILQPYFIGKPNAIGTGMIPGDCLGRMVAARGLPEAYQTIYVKHVTGGWSELSFKSFEQGRESFQGTSKHLIWLDEECEMDIYTECVTRTMATGAFQGGIIICTFTPLWGMSDVVKYFRGISLDAKES
jgi:phage terminase large subunit-like protein